MRKIRGFKLGKRLVRVFRRVCRRPRRRGYSRLAAPQALRTSGSSTERRPQQQSSLSKLGRLCNWAGLIRSKAKSLCWSKPGSGYVPVGAEPVKPVPKGHLAVYVGRKDGRGGGESRRVVVPVIYFNHPLFGQLLREAEEEYGYEHEGGITIPCQISEFHKVQTTIEKGGRRTSMTWKKHHQRSLLM